MSAWDVGMRSNDNALDAIYVFRNRINRMPANGQGALLLLNDVVGQFKKSQNVTFCVLGVAESLMQQGVKLPTKAKDFLAVWIGRALLEIKSQDWDDPNARMLAIGRFARRLSGEKISTDEDNHSLFEGIQRVRKS